MANARFPAHEIEESALDWAVALLQRHRELASRGALTPSHRRHLRPLLSNVVWYWDGKGKHKYLGVPAWSHEALASYRRNGGVVTTKGRGDALVHEHVMPRKAVVDALLDLDPVSPASVRDLLDRLAVVAIVTESEHRRLDDSILDRDDPWLRYRVANVEVARGGDVVAALGDAADFPAC